MARYILCCKREKGLVTGCFINFDDIYRISKESKETVFYTKTGDVYYDISTLADYYDCLKEDGFDFIDRSELVRIDKIIEVDTRITAQRVTFEGGKLEANVAVAYLKKVMNIPGINIIKDIKSSIHNLISRSKK